MALTPKDFVRIAKALADPMRLQILEQAARQNDLSCASLCALFPVTQATISHHTKELIDAGLLERSKTGQFVFYRFCDDVMNAYCQELTSRFRLGKPGAPRPRAARTAS